MKYIRTDNTNFIYKFNDDADYMQYDNIKGHIVRVADTIEELCDEFVLKTTSKESGKSYYGLYYYTDIKRFKVKNGFKGVWYGAIWTDKGLIYVAEMNEKGDLELI